MSTLSNPDSNMINSDQPATLISKQERVLLLELEKKQKIGDHMLQQRDNIDQECAKVILMLPSARPSRRIPIFPRIW